MSAKPFPASKEASAVHNTKGKQGAGVIVFCTKTRRILLGKRGQDCGNPSTWAPFGGMVDPGEDPFTAAFRELSEEAGITVDPSTHPGVTDLLYTDTGNEDGFEFFTYGLVLEEEVVPQLNAESSGFVWCGTHELPVPQHPGVQKMFQDPLVIQILARFHSGNLIGPRETSA